MDLLFTLGAPCLFFAIAACAWLLADAGWF